MISRIEFYICFTLLIALMIGNIFSTDSQTAEIQRAKTETLDSILQVQRDSALAKALQAEMKADSIQALLNRKNLDIQTIKNKTQDEKKNVLILNADSTLSLFTRTVTH